MVSFSKNSDDFFHKLLHLMWTPKSAPNQCKCLIVSRPEMDILATHGIPRGVNVDYGLSADAGSM